MGRAPCCDKANVKKGPWSPEEDAKLKEFIEKYGTGGNWVALPQKAGLKRCGKSCRLRWLNYLRPNIKHGEFSDEEDRIICSLFVSIGSRWSIIASQLPGRTDNDIKNYWNTKLKKKLLGITSNQRKPSRSKQQHHPQQHQNGVLFSSTEPTMPSIPNYYNTTQMPLLTSPDESFTSMHQNVLTSAASDLLKAFPQYQRKVKDEYNMIAFNTEHQSWRSSTDGSSTQIGFGNKELEFSHDHYALRRGEQVKNESFFTGTDYSSDKLLIFLSGQGVNPASSECNYDEINQLMNLNSGCNYNIISNNSLYLDLPPKQC